MVKNQLRGNERDERSHANTSLAAKKLMKHHGNLSSISKNLKSNRSSLILNSDANITTKIMAHPSGTAPQNSGACPSPSPSTKKNNLMPSSNQSPNPSAKKTISMEKMKTVSGRSTSRIISLKKKSKGKEKPQVEVENTQSCKRNLDLSSSSPLSKKEEGSTSTKRKRVLLHARTYRDLFKPHSKTCKPSPPKEVYLEHSSGSKSANEGTPSASEASKTNMVSENNAEGQALSLAEARAESASDEMECEILPAPQYGMDESPAAGSSSEANTSKKVLENNAKEEEATSVGEATAESTSDEMECEIIPSPQCKVDDPPAAGSTREVDPEAVTVENNAFRIPEDCTSKIAEYWVPARFSKVQLELYCSTLLSNSIGLCSFSKIDHVGGHRELLVSMSKCCDHPYLVDLDLQVAVTKERPISDVLDISVYASGKLLLLDKLLHKMKACGLRVIIVFQSGGGSGRNQIGDILNDFLRLRFGVEAYEHVERGLPMSKKQTTMNTFNDKSKGRFVFLVENRACLPSLKLSSVDAVLIYNSDWNPMNDTRILQRINVQPDRVPIFRFYSPCAVEEKVLSLAKQDVFLDSNLHNMVPVVSQSLLSWGAERLFSLLHQLHLQSHGMLKNYDSAFVSPEDLAFVDLVVNEILDRVCGNSGGEKDVSLLVEAHPRGESYSHDSSPLIGEKKGATSLHGGDPRVFWSALLEGKNPRWRFIQSDGSLQMIGKKVWPFDNSENPSVAAPSGGGETEESRRKKKNKNEADTSVGIQFDGSLQRISKKVQPFDNSENHSVAAPSEGGETEESRRRRRRKKKKNEADPSVVGMAMLPRGKTGMTRSARNPSLAVSTWNDLSGISAEPSQQEILNRAAVLPFIEVGTNIGSLQRGIYLKLQPQLLNLCQSAGLPDYVKTMAGMLLEYVMDNFKVDDGEDAAIVQTLVISLCWRAASLFKLWVDPLQLMALASEKLHYNCKADAVESIYCRLKVLKMKFQEKADAMVVAQIPSIRFGNKLFEVPKQEVITLPETPSSDEEIIEIPASMSSQSKNANETDAERDNAKGKLLKAQLDLIEKVCSKREEALLEKHQKQVAEMEHFKEREVMRFTKEQQSRLETFHGTGNEDEVRKVKEEFERKMSALEAHVGKERGRLQALHAATRELERCIKEGWIQNSKSGNLEDDFDHVPLSDCGKFIVQEFNWDPPTVPLILEENLIERGGDGDMASGLPNYTPSHTPQGTGIVAVEVMPVVPAARGDTAAKSTSQHREGEISSVERYRNTMMEQVVFSEGTPRTNSVEPTLADAIESSPHDEAAEGTQPAKAPNPAPPAHAVVSTAPAESIELTATAETTEPTPPIDAVESIVPAEAIELTPTAEATELTPPIDAVGSTTTAEAIELAPPAEATEPNPPIDAVETTTTAEAIDLTPPTEATEPNPPIDAVGSTSIAEPMASPAEATEETPLIDAVGSTTPAEAIELTPPADAPDLPPPAEAEELTMPSQTVDSISSLTAATIGSAAGEVAVANGDIIVISDGNTIADPIGILPHDLSAYVSRDAASLLLPQQRHGAVLPSQVSPRIPNPAALVQDAGRQGAQVNTSNVVCNGLGTANVNGTTVGVPLGPSYGPFWQMLPIASPMVFPYGLHADPLMNELTRIKQQENRLVTHYKTKKMQLDTEMKEEFEQLRRRYEEMLQGEEDTYQRLTQHLEEAYRKLKLNQSLAEEFRDEFIEHRTPLSFFSAPSQIRNLVPGSRQMPMQSGVPQQIQTEPTPAAAPQPGSVTASANENSSRPQLIQMMLD